MSSVPTLRMNDGRDIPQLGFGTWQIPDAEAEATVREALRLGYRLIDTAAAYGNERGVGAAVAASGLPEDAVFLTTKLANPRHGAAEARAALRESLDRLARPSVDLYLIHWPIPRRGLYLETWQALIGLREAGLARSIGVSNFTIAHLERVIGETGVVPAVNQIELHPRFQQKALRDFHARHGILTQSWSPLGRGRLLDDPVIAAIAARLGRTPAQVILRWHIELGLVVIPKSVTPARIAENAGIFDFRLAAEDLETIERLDDPAGRVGPDPETFG